MKHACDLTGQRFGRLVVQRLDHYNDRHVSYWECLCDCGKTHIVCGTSLTRGSTRSCGCLHDEKAKERATKHGKAHTDLYYIWQAMRKRCLDKNSKDYHNYGARGITVCDDWANSYISFQDWALKNGYTKGLSLDRINNDKQYCPKNCRWATRSQQNNNTRRTKKIKYQGKTQTLTEWCEELGLKRDTIYARIYCYGWSIPKAFTTTKRN